MDLGPELLQRGNEIGVTTPSDSDQQQAREPSLYRVASSVEKSGYSVAGRLVRDEVGETRPVG